MNPVRDILYYEISLDGDIMMSALLKGLVCIRRMCSKSTSCL